MDISPEAINLLADDMPQHRFICQDIVALSFPCESFDVVSSVTVLQHMPQRKQQLALSLASQGVKRGGYLVLLENVLGFDAPDVFPHPTDEWVRMVEAAGLRCRYCWGSNFEVLFRVEARILRQLRGNKPSGEAMIPSTGQMDNSPRSLALNPEPKRCWQACRFPRSGYVRGCLSRRPRTMS